MAKTIRVPMTDPKDGTRVYWRVTREKLLAGPIVWMFEDHEGYERFGGETWLDLLDRFCATAENYGLVHRLS